MLGEKGDDCVGGGLGRDLISGGPGDDTLHALGQGHDVVKCGPGRDTVIAGARDKVAKSCERVRHHR